MNKALPASWMRAVGAEFEKPYFSDLESFVDEQRLAETILPPEDEVFAAFNHTPLDQVKVLLLGQDPYHDLDQAHGLCFSVKPGIKPPPSLRNMFKELEDDLGVPAPSHGCLTSWARQGVFMLNTVLTVRAHEAHSHKRKGWETFTTAVIQAVNAGPEPVVFVLWGKPAQKFKPMIDDARHAVLESAHPSPLSARRGFFESRPFSAINAQLADWGKEPIDWQLPDPPTL